MPCSLYLGEAFSALQFKYLDQMGFYTGCIFSGVSGIFLQLSALRFGRWRQQHWNGAIARLPTVTVAFFIYDNSSIAGPLWLLIMVQIFTSISFSYSSYCSEVKTTNQENVI